MAVPLLLLLALPLAAAFPGPAAPAPEPFLVLFHGSPGPSAHALLDRLGFTALHAYTTVPALLVEGPPGAVHALASQPQVRSVRPDAPLTFHLGTSVAEVGARPGRTPGALEGLGVDGSGVGIAVVDTGLDATHPDLPLGSKVVRNVEVVRVRSNAPYLVADAPSTDLASGHGTHVAAIAAGTGQASGGQHRGVAPGAPLVGVGVGELGRLSSAAAGLDWVAQHAAPLGVRVVTNSWGIDASPYDPGGVVEALVAQLHAQGMVVVFSVGNGGLGPDGQPTWGQDTLSGLAMSPHVLGVTAYDAATMALSDLASRGDASKASLAAKDGTHRRPDLAAPGEHVWSAAAALSGPIAPLSPRVPGRSDYLAMTGTSMAAPHVAGAAALVLQALDAKGCASSPAVVGSVLTRTARGGVLRDGLGDAPGPAGQGHGALDAYAAVRLVQDAPTCDLAAAPLPPSIPGPSPAVRGDLHAYALGVASPAPLLGARTTVAAGEPVVLAVRWASGLDPSAPVGAGTRGRVEVAPAGGGAALFAADLTSAAAEPAGVGWFLATDLVALEGVPPGVHVLRAWLDAGSGAWIPREAPLEVVAPPGS